jgi:shikimate kinase
MRDSQLVYIIGFMGSGKSTAGKKLAAALDWSFIDLDKRIEEHTGNAVPDLFSQFGEEYFRNIEAETLRSLKGNKTTVVSTGGGTPCYGDNMDYMLKTGLTIYLKLTPSQLQSRLTGSKTVRPLIKGLDASQLIGFIEEKLAVREEWYRKADITIIGVDLDVNALKSLVLEKLYT